MEYGDLGKRFLAVLIDDIIVWALLLITWATLGIVGVICSSLIVILYYVLLEGGSWHATLGKRVMGLYIADGDGVGINYTTSILRFIGRCLCSPILPIAILIACFNENKQTLYDMIAKTYVLSGESEKAGNFDYHNGNALAELVAVTGPLSGMIYQVDENGLIIGRDSISCQVVVPNSQSNVSRIHCYITYNPMSGMFVLNDRNSTHGTYLANGSRVAYSQPAALKSGDRFYLATPENTFEVR